MWVFPATRFRRWVLLAIALPMGRLLAHRLALAAEHRDPSTPDGEALHQTGSAVTAASSRTSRRTAR